MAKSTPRKKRALKKTVVKTIKKAAKKIRAPKKKSRSSTSLGIPKNTAKGLRGTCSVYCRNEGKTVGRHLSEAAAETLARTHCDGQHAVQCRQ